MTHAKESLNFRSEDIIPKERKNRSRFIAVLLLVLLLLFILFFLCRSYSDNNNSTTDGTDDKKSTSSDKESTPCSVHILYFVVHCLMMKGITCFLKGICDFVEEIYHLKTRYSGKPWKALQACLNCNIFLLVTLFLIIGFGEKIELLQWIQICLVCICDLFFIALGIQMHTEVDISRIIDQKHLNVAQGLAWSYYIGYLKIILPRFKDSIRQFNEDNANILRCEDTCKLHILIPLSCTLYDNLSSADSNIEHFKNLPSLSADRAGIKERNFKNSVYRIFDEEKRPSYCIVEYATPLSSLYEMSNISSTAFSREDRIQQAKLFYRTLEHILETALDSNYRHLYRLIPYDDCQENDNEEHFLSNLILKHIQQQKAEEYVVTNGNIHN